MIIALHIANENSQMTGKHGLNLTRLAYPFHLQGSKNRNASEYRKWWLVMNLVKHSNFNRYSTLTNVTMQWAISGKMITAIDKVDGLS